nr:VOC family protein [Rhodopirellula sp. SM50]
MMISSTSTNNAASVIRVKAIDHVTIVVDDLSRSRDFYRDLLGMVEVDRPDFGFPGHWLQAGATQVHLIETMAGSSEPGGGLDPDQVSSGLTHHFAFEVDDAELAHQILLSAGVRIQGGPRKRPDGCMQLWFYDPDGHCVEVFDRTGSTPDSGEQQ